VFETDTAKVQLRKHTVAIKQPQEQSCYSK